MALLLPRTGPCVFTDERVPLDAQPLVGDIDDDLFFRCWQATGFELNTQLIMNMVLKITMYFRHLELQSDLGGRA